MHKTTNMIFIQQDSPFEDETLIIEEDEQSVWAYRYDKNKELIQDGFLCSRGQLVENREEIKIAIDKGLAPPLLRSFHNKHSVQSDLQEKAIQAEWISNDEI